MVHASAKNRVLVTFLGAVLMHSTAFAQIGLPEYDIPAMTKFLSGLTVITTLPPRHTSPYRAQPSADELSPETLEIFAHLQATVFGKQLLSLKTCGDCQALSDYASQTIFVEPSFVRGVYKSFGAANGRLIVEFLLAHEISHVVQELSIGAGGRAGLSLNGLHSLFAEDETQTAQEGHEAHAEVDAYALLILRRDYARRPTILLRFFRSLLQELTRGHEEDRQVMIDDVKVRVDHLTRLIARPEVYSN